MIDLLTGLFTDGLHIIGALVAVVLVCIIIAWTLVLVGWGLLVLFAYIARWIITIRRRIKYNKIYNKKLKEIMKRDELTRTKLLIKIQDYNTKGIYSNIYHISTIETGLHQRDEYLIYLDESFYFVTFDTNVDSNVDSNIGSYEIINEERAIKYIH